MKVRPDGLCDDEVAAALHQSWGIDVRSIRYAPVGGGSYHWIVDDETRARWFVTATDLDASSWLGSHREEAARRLEAAMTASSMLHESGLDFVLAPQTTRSGARVHRLLERYGITVHPHREGWSGDFGGELTPARQLRLAEMLASLHRTALPNGQLDAHQLAIDDVDLIQRSLDRVPSVMLPVVERALDSFRTLAERCLDRQREMVVTHGEPHPGNVIDIGERLLLIDWDTVRLALPERDLWLLGAHGGDALRHYGAMSGSRVDPGALLLYQLDWRLQEVAGPIRDLGSASVEDERRLRSQLDRALETLAAVRFDQGSHVDRRGPA